MSLWWSFRRPFDVYPKFVGRSKKGTEFGLMVDGDELCVRLGECGGRLNMDSVLADGSLQRL